MASTVSIRQKDNTTEKSLSLFLFYLHVTLWCFYIKLLLSDGGLSVTTLVQQIINLPPGQGTQLCGRQYVRYFSIELGWR